MDAGVEATAFATLGAVSAFLFGFYLHNSRSLHDFISLEALPLLSWSVEKGLPPKAALEAWEGVLRYGYKAAGAAPIIALSGAIPIFLTVTFFLTEWLGWDASPFLPVTGLFVLLFLMLIVFADIWGSRKVRYEYAKGLTAISEAAGKLEAEPKP